MWSLGTSPALLLLLGLVIGFAFFVGTLISAWSNRSDPVYRKAAKVSAIVSALLGGVVLSYWLVVADRPIDLIEGVLLFAVCVAPSFTISHHLYLRSQRMR